MGCDAKKYVFKNNFLHGVIPKKGNIAGPPAIWIMNMDELVSKL